MKMKYEVILSQHKECETSLWLNRPLLVWRGLKWSYLISNQYMSLSSDSWPTKIVVIAIIDFFQLLIENSTDFTFLHYRISHPFTLNLKQKRKEEYNINNFPFFKCYPNEKIHWHLSLSIEKRLRLRLRGGGLILVIFVRTHYVDGP